MSERCVQRGEIRVLPSEHRRPDTEEVEGAWAGAVSRQPRACATDSERVKQSLLILLPPHALLQPLYGLICTCILEINTLSKETVIAASMYRWFNSHLFHRAC